MYNYRDYYNYMNNTYNQPVYKDSNKLFDNYNGFIRGNMFPHLYNTYKSNEPYPIKPSNEQTKILTDIDALTFSLIDMNLYLDVNPEDRNIIKQYNENLGKLKQYIDMYQDKYGILLPNSMSLNKYPWQWINSPFPWENE